jgi:hypothetical protein
LLNSTSTRWLQVIERVWKRSSTPSCPQVCVLHI